MPFANTVNKMSKSTGLFVLLYLVLINAYTLVMLQIFFQFFHSVNCYTAVLWSS